MNYWSLGKKKQISFWQKIEELLFKLVDVESQQRNKFDSFVIIVNYIMSYAIVFVLIMQSLARQFINSTQRSTFNSPEQAGIQRLSVQQITNNNYKTIIILLLIRIGLSIVYIVFQKVPILLFIKSLLIVNLFMAEYQSSKEQFLTIQIPLLFVQLIALAVWANKIERRIVHFDSRLNTIMPFLKDSMVFMTAFLIKRAQKMSFAVTILGDWNGGVNFTINQITTIQLISACLVFIVFIDFGQILYNEAFKCFLLSLDLAFIALLASWTLSVHLTGKNAAYFNYLMLLGTLIGLQVILLFRKQDFHQLYEIEGRKLQFESQTTLIRYFECLRRLIKSEQLSKVLKNIAIIRFILYHRSSCLYLTCPFTRRYNMQDSLQLKCQLIEEYMLKSLQKLSKTRPLLKKYLIFYLSPKDKIFKYIDEKSSYMKRQHWRIKQIERKLNNEIMILEAQVTKKIVTELIEIYLTYGKRFFQILLKENINCRNLVRYGQRMLDVVEKIEAMKTNSANFTQGVRILINNFSSRLINDFRTQILQTVVDPPFLLHKTTQSGPMFIVSAEPQNFLRIIDANIICTKEFYYPREVFLSVTVIDLLPEQIKVKHKIHFDQAAKKTEFDGKKDFPTSLFVMNKNGFVTFFIAVVYLLNSIKGRIWCVAIQITHKMDSIILIAKQGNGVVMGISQMAVFHGLKTTDKGKELTEQFYKKLTTKIEGTNKYKSVTVQAYEHIFENSDFEFCNRKAFQIVQYFSAFGLSYFLVEIRSLQQISSSVGRSSILRSLLSLQNKQSVMQITEEQKNFVAKDQMYYHSDGVIRFYPQKTQQIMSRFESLVQKSEVQDEQGNCQLDENITEMRLVDDQLDFLQNIEEETEFMSKPKTQIEKKQHELKRFNMKIQFFQECFQQRKTKLPKWLKYTRIYFVIIILLLGSVITISFGYNNVRLQTVQFVEALLNGISDNQINYIRLSKLLLAAKYYDPSIALNFKQIVSSVNKEIENSSQEMFGIDASVEQYFSQKQIDKTLSQYLIAFNNITAQGNVLTFDEKSVLQNLVVKIVPAFSSLMSSRIDGFQANNRKVFIYSLLLMIGFIFLLATVFVWVVATTSHILKQKEYILSILTKTRDALLERQLTKLQLFEEYLYFDKDIYCEDDLQYIMKMNNQKGKEGGEIFNRELKKKMTFNRKFSWKKKKAQLGEDSEKNKIDQAQTQHKIMVTEKQVESGDSVGQKDYEQDGTLYIKKLVNHQSMNGVRLITMFWICFMAVLSFLMYRSVLTYGTVSQRIFRIEYNIQRMQSSSDLVWILINSFPYDIEQIESYQEDMYNAQSEFKSGVIDMFKEKYFSVNFMDFYVDIWTEDCCKYIEGTLPQCRSVLNGALAEGADQIIAYLDRKYDFFIASKLNNTDFRSKQITKALSHLKLQYMMEVVKKNIEMLSQQHDSYAGVFERELFIYFITIIIGLGFIGVVYKLLSKENQSLMKIERLFKLVEFNSLKDMKEFKLYFKENYHDKFYK